MPPGRAVTTIPAPRRPVPARPSRTVEPAPAGSDALRSFSRAAIAIARNALDPAVNPGDYAARTWPADRNVPMLLRAAVSPFALADAPGLVVLGLEFLKALTPVSAGADLLGRGLQVRFDRTGAITIPALAPAVAAFVSEGEPIPVVEARPAADVTLTRHKLAVIASATREMLNSSAVEELIKTTLLEATGPAVDRVLLSTAAAGPDRPAGLLHSIPPTPPTTGDLLDDVAMLTSAVAPVAGNGGIAIVAAPAQAVQINLRTPRAVYPVLTSTSLSVGTIIAIALPAIVSALDSPQIDASRDALVHQESASPAVDLGGVSVTPLRSFYQTDSVGLRLRWPISWALRDPHGIAWTEGI
jgi:hypothetical protein